MKKKLIQSLFLIFTLIFSLCLNSCEITKPYNKSEDKKQVEIDNHIFQDKNKGSEGGIVMNTSKASIIQFGFHFDGTIGGYNYDYILQKEGEQYFFIYKNMAKLKPDERKIEVDETVLKQVYDIYKKYDIEKWNGFNKSDSNVLDGKRFTLEISFDNGEILYASGDNQFPKHYNDFQKELEEILQPLVKEIYEIEKKEAIEKGVKGELQYAMVIFNERGLGKLDSYRFVLNKKVQNGFNFSVEIKCENGGLFEAGDYQYYTNLPEEAINFKGIKELFEKYDLIQWYGYNETAENDETSEWFDIYFSFEEGHVFACGTLHPKNYKACRMECMDLIADNIKEAKEKYGLKVYKK